MKKTLFLFFLLIPLLFFITTCEDVDTIPPTVSITFPLSWSVVNELVVLTCVSTDNKEVSKVELWINGEYSGISDNSEPYKLEWNTTTYENGSYTITIRSYDSSDNVTDSEPIILTVDNSGSYPIPVNIIDITYDLTNMAITWGKSEDTDFEKYELLVAETPNGTPSILYETTDINEISHQLTDFNPTISKYYWICVTDTFGYTTAGNIVHVLDTKPTVPSFDSIFFEDNSFTISWAESPDNDFKTYKIYVSNDNFQSNDEILFQTNNISETSYNYIPNNTREFLYFYIKVLDIWDLENSSSIEIGSSYPITIFFTSNEQLFTCDEFGYNKKQLTFSGDHNDGFFDISPDGSKVVFLWYENWTGRRDIGIMNIDGSDWKILTDNSSLTNENPIFTPDGQNILYSTEISDQNYEIFTMSLDGSNKTNLTNKAGSERHPNISSNGNYISYDGGNLYIINSSGDEETRVNEHDWSYRSYSQFSSDETFLVYVTRDVGIAYYEISKGTDSSIETIRKANIYINPVDDLIYNLKLSPDGNSLYFDSVVNGTYQLFKMSFDGTSLTQLTDNSNHFGSYNISPDGEHIIFTLSSGGCWLMKNDGSELRQLNNFDHPIGSPIFIRSLND